MVKKENVIRFRMLVIAANCLLASLSLINLYTIGTGAIMVEIPEEEDFAWTLDTKYEEATFFADFTVSNRGVYDIENLDIHAQVITEAGTVLIDYDQEDLTIPSGQVKRFNILAVLPFNRIDPEEWRVLMFNDSVFYLDVDINAKYLWGLGEFVVDDTLEYVWEAPMKKVGNKTDESFVQLLNYIFTENKDISGFMDMLWDKVGESALLEKLDWLDASLRVESWPLGGNTSRIVVTLTKDVLDGRRTLIFEVKLLLKVEGEEYDVSWENFRFDYQ